MDTAVKEEETQTPGEHLAETLDMLLEAISDGNTAREVIDTLLLAHIAVTLTSVLERLEDRDA